MAATLFFPPPAIPSSNPDHLPDEQEVEPRLLIAHHHHHHHHHTNADQGGEEDPEGPDPSAKNSSHTHDQVGEEDEEEQEGDDEEVEEEDDEEEEEVEVEVVGDQPPNRGDPNNPSNTLEDDPAPGGSGINLGTLIGRRVTLKPRRTLSLSPTPARAGDMMARNLRAACWLDFTNEDDDDGLYQPPDPDTDIKRRTICGEETCSSAGGKVRVTRRGGSLTLGAITGLSKDFIYNRRGSSSMKRPLEVTLPCQEIQYLDISYQKVGIHSVQFSPIPRKKIAYHPVPYHAIHYCDVPYLGERPVKRKPPA